VALVANNAGVYPSGSPDLTVSEGLVRFGRHIETQYIGDDGRPAGTAADSKITLGYFKQMFGPTSLCEFGPRQLKTVR
jgi:hypothetical protein